MDGGYHEPPLDIEEEAQARLEAIRQLQWGLRAIDRMMREGNIEDAIAFTRETVSAMDQEEDTDRELGLDPDRFSAEDGSDSGCYDPDHWDCNSCFEICLDCHPEKIGGQDSIGENICMDCVARQMALKEPCECGYNSPYVTRSCIECLNCFGCEVQLYQSGDYGMVCTDCAPNVFNAESDEDELYYIQLRPKFAMGYVHHHRAFSNLEDAQSAARILSLEFPAKHRGVLGITKGKGYPYNFMLTKSSCRMCGADSENPCVCMIGPEVRPCSDKPIKKWQSDSVMYQPCPCSDVTDGFSAEDDPVSRIAAGTNDALADFANSHDTDDGFYFLGGLIGGLAIAVTGNVLADRLQEWWRGRSA